MVSNDTIAEKMDHLMEYYRSQGDSEKAVSFSTASTAIRNLEKPVMTMSADELKKTTQIDDTAIQKIREYMETGKMSEFGEK